MWINICISGGGYLIRQHSVNPILSDSKQQSKDEGIKLNVFLKYIDYCYEIIFYKKN